MTMEQPNNHYDLAIKPSADAARAKGGRLELLATVGSRAYGTHNADSDWDFKGIYFASAVERARLNPRVGSIKVPGDADITLYELGQFAALAAKANPTILELLWSPSITGSGGAYLLRHRELFLSRRIEQTYGGYAMSQALNAVKGTGGSRGTNQYKRTKFKLHTLRLIDAGIHALKHGQIMIEHPNPKKLLAQAESMTPEELVEYVKASYDVMHLMAVNSDLPEKPDEAKIDELLFNLRST